MKKESLFRDTSVLLCLLLFTSLTSFSKSQTPFQYFCSLWQEQVTKNDILPREIEAVDLGLPSGTKWANMNVGASKPEDYGGYFAWGETKEKTENKWNNYIHCDGTNDTCHNIGNDISGTKYDVAHVKWGGNWQMPTLEQFVELYMCCEGEWTTVKGVKGYKFTSEINGNSIFFPATLDNGFGRYGAYWLSSLYPDDSRRENTFFFERYDADSKSSSRCFGLSVRPVLKSK